MKKTTGYLYTRNTKKHGAIYCLRYEVNGKRHKVTLKDEAGSYITSKRKAKTAVDKILAPLQARDEAGRRQALAHQFEDALETAEKLEAASRPRLAMADAWQAYLDSPKRPDTGPTTLQQYSFQWRQFAEWHEDNHPDRPYVGDVDAAEGEAYATNLQRRGLSPSTFNKHVGLLRLVFRIIGPLDGMESNPFSEVSKKKPGNRQATRRDDLSRDQLHRLFDAAEGELKTLLFLGLYLGQRLGDCCTLQWAQVDLSRRTVFITPSKTGRTGADPLKIAIHKDLHNILEATPPADRSGDVLPELAAKYRHDRTRVTDKIMGLFRSVGIHPYKEGTGPGTDRRAVIRYGFHSLRHSAVSFMQEAGMPFSVVQSIVGHNSTAMTQHYTHTSDEASGKAIAALPSITGTPDTAPDPLEELAKIAARLDEEGKNALIVYARQLAEASEPQEDTEKIQKKLQKTSETA